MLVKREEMLPVFCTTQGCIDLASYPLRAPDRCTICWIKQHYCRICGEKFGWDNVVVGSIPGLRRHERCCLKSRCGIQLYPTLYPFQDTAYFDLRTEKRLKEFGVTDCVICGFPCRPVHAAYSKKFHVCINCLINKINNRLEKVLVKVIIDIVHQYLFW
jgi:hypothetical protein